MKAIGYATPGTLDRDDALVDIEIDRPTAKGRDLLVAVAAVAVNPLDTKVRKAAAPEPEQWKVLGWDAVGRVVATGKLVTKFRPGDRVYYAGSISRPGADSEFHLVDERMGKIVLSEIDASALSGLNLRRPLRRPRCEERSLPAGPSAASGHVRRACAKQPD